MECGSKKPRAPSTTLMRASSVIRTTHRKRTGARPLVVVHCYRESDSIIRIISVRKATKKEVRFYEEGI
jgi:uncharacterized DUF497 family protein